MQKIYLVTFTVFNFTLVGFKHTHIAFSNKDKMQEFLDSCDKRSNEFFEWWEAIEEPCQKMNHDEMLTFIENQKVPVEWKMQCSDYRHAHPELKLEENFIQFCPEYQEIDLI